MSRKIRINTEFHVVESIGELSKSDQELLTLAEVTSARAYAPYSNFLVGAAILLEDKSIITGNNQENVAYPSGLCAERVALFYASSQNPDLKIHTIVIYAQSKKSPKRFIDKPVSPCGACRQVMSEYELKQNQPIRVIMSSNQVIYISDSVSNLLPLSFNGDHL